MSQENIAMVQYVLAKTQTQLQGQIEFQKVDELPLDKNGKPKGFTFSQADVLSNGKAVGTAASFGNRTDIIMIAKTNLDDIAHETGHGLQLPHPHDNKEKISGVNKTKVDGITNAKISVMSYNDERYSTGFGVADLEAIITNYGLKLIEQNKAYTLEFARSTKDIIATCPTVQQCNDSVLFVNPDTGIQTPFVNTIIPTGNTTIDLSKIVADGIEIPVTVALPITEPAVKEFTLITQNGQTNKLVIAAATKSYETVYNPTTMQLTITPDSTPQVTNGSNKRQL
jgi:hypothetical protein